MQTSYLDETVAEPFAAHELDSLDVKPNKLSANHDKQVKIVSVKVL